MTTKERFLTEQLEAAAVHMTHLKAQILSDVDKRTIITYVDRLRDELLMTINEQR